MPRGNIVANAAKMLNVSADYLLGVIDTPKPIFDETDEQEEALLTAFRELSDERKDAAVDMINGLRTNKE